MNSSLPQQHSRNNLFSLALSFLLLASFIGLAVFAIFSNAQAASGGRIDFGTGGFPSQYKVGDTVFGAVYEVTNQGRGCTQFTINYNSSVLSATGASSVEGMFNGYSGMGSEYIQIIRSSPERITFRASCSGQTNISRNGRNFIANVTFRVVGEGSTSVTVSQATVAGSSSGVTTGSIPVYVPATTCPSGYTGTPPNCTKIPPPPPPTCPSGYTGTPPNCTKIPPPTCPSGYTGTPPNCTKIPTQPSNPPVTPPVTPPRPPVVPPGTPISPAPQGPSQPSVPERDLDSPSSTETERIDKMERLGDVNVTASVRDARVLFNYAGDINNVKFTYSERYGEEKELAITSDSSSGPFRVSLIDLKPVTLYNFSITDTEGLKYSGEIITSGFPVRIGLSSQIQDTRSISLFVANGNETFRINFDNTGKAAFLASPGELRVSLYESGEPSQKFEVEEIDADETGTIPTQDFVFNITAEDVKKAKSSMSMALLGTILAIVALIGAVVLIFLFIKRRKRRKQEQLTMRGEQLVEAYMSGANTNGPASMGLVDSLNNYSQITPEETQMNQDVWQNSYNPTETYAPPQAPGDVYGMPQQQTYPMPAPQEVAAYPQPVALPQPYDAYQPGVYIPSTEAPSTYTPLVMVDGEILDIYEQARADRRFDDLSSKP